MKSVVKLSIAIISVLVFVPSLAYAYHDVVIWDADNPLTWDDFQGTPDDVDSAAWIYWWNDWQWKFSVNKVDDICTYRFDDDFTGQAVMRIYDSWVWPDEKSDELLNHEQRHFDLAHVYAVKFKNKLADIDHPCPEAVNVHNKIDKITKRTEDRFTKRSNLMTEVYDNETNRGINATAQAEWDQKIDSLLDIHVFGQYSKAIKGDPTQLVFTGSTGKSAIFENRTDNSIETITTLCIANDYILLLAQLGGDGDCVFDDGTDLYVWTTDRKSIGIS